MAEENLKSALDITHDCIVDAPVQPAPFIPGSANLFSKFPTHISKDSWELWEFDSFSADGALALGCSLYRDARGFEKGGFHAEVNALWPDGRHWGKTLFFAESIVNKEQDGRVRGLWRAKTDVENGEQESKISFSISADCSAATLRFEVPGELQASVEFSSTSTTPPVSRFPTSETEAQLCPDVFYMFPMGPIVASVDATISVPSNGNNEQRKLHILAEEGGRGGMVRGWSGKAWPTFLNDAYYVVAQVGPYNLQMLRILGTVFSQHRPGVVARLYYNNELVGAANDFHDPGSSTDLESQAVPRDTVQVVKVVPDPDSAETQGLAGKFRDPNSGYTFKLVTAHQRKLWKFDIKHKRAVWSEPTSAPGPDGTGKSGWIESFSGGRKGERYEGTGFGGQLQIPVP
ncbi:Nn.00g074790.m01.CDS01 [Neocucurbitaria sp. VM-36]